MTQTAGVAVRQAQPQDLAQLVDLRMQMFAEVGPGLGALPNPQDRAATERFFQQAFASGQSTTWVAEVEGHIVATGTLAEFQRPPYPGNLSGLEAYVLNMFTLGAYRRRGISAQVLVPLMAHARAKGYGKVWLHATDDGRKLYERFGFAPNPREMEWHPQPGT